MANPIELRIRRFGFLIALAIPLGLYAQVPAINYRGIVNAADYASAGLPSGGIAQGSIFSIFGSNLGPASGVKVSSFPLQNTFLGVSIKLVQGSTQLNVIPIYVSSVVVNAIMPSNAPVGMSSLQVTYNNSTSNSSPVLVVTNSFHMFTSNGTGSGPGAILNFNADGTAAVNSLQRPATPGQAIIAYGTGLGAVAGGDNVAPPVANLPVQVEAWVGGQSAQVLYSGRATAGEDQINLAIPSTAPQGCWVPVYFRVAGSITSNSATIAISNGGPCSDPANPMSQTFIGGGKLGIMRLFRSNVVQNIAVQQSGTVISDQFVYDFSQVTGGQYSFSSLFSQPPAGSCNVFLLKGDFFGSSGTFADASTVSRRLDAGSTATLSGGAANITLTPDTNQMGVPLGSSATVLPTLGDHTVLTPGPYTVIAGGGADIPAFQAKATYSPPFTWNEQSTLNTVSRGQPLTVTWSGLPSGQSMLIMGGNADLPSNSSALFYCMAPPSATSFIIPAAVLEAIPVTRADARQSKGMLYLMGSSLGNGTVLSITGLDSAVAVAYFVAGKTVIFQ